MRSIDFDITLKATAGDVQFDETKEGTFGVRVPTEMDVDHKPTGGKIVTSEGKTDKDAWGTRAAWVDYAGNVGGEHLGIAVLNHPTSFRFPTRWHVRTYGLFAANPFGATSFDKETTDESGATIKDGESITLNYRVIFHKGDAESADIAAAFKEYAATK
ncbi:MAG: PmoA family protein [Pirellulales bacterium]